MRNRLPAPNKVLKNERGVALLLALFAFVLLTFVAFEVSRDTTIDHVVARQQVSRVQAYYAAKAGVEISLLRIKLYKQALASFGDNLGANRSMLDPIWNFPFVWPPTLMDAELTEVDKSMMKSVVGESFMEAQFTTQILPESGRIDINDLGSPLKDLRAAMIAQLVKIFEAEVEHNEEFRKKYAGYNFQELVNNIADYIDEDSESLNGGDETAYYRDIDDTEAKIPPNRPLRTTDELHMVSGMNDDFYNVLVKKITIFGTKGINVNYANKETLMALDRSMTEEAADKIIERRTDPQLGGPFQNAQDFFSFAQNWGVDTQAIIDSKVPILTDTELNFRIVSTGVMGNVKREITAITYDFAAISKTVAEKLKEQDQGAGGGGDKEDEKKDEEGKGEDKEGEEKSPTEDKDKKTKQEAPKGRPRVVYWEET